ncbi:MAG: hypothetical protein GWQ08_20615 [Verrucomicrobiaceae bacterium]|nr:hypothetical protein [Verrucomicrobiaceae bacterium]
MDDHSIPNSSHFQESFYIRPSKWRFDLVRAKRERINQKGGTLDLPEKSKRIQTVIRQIGQLISEYTETAERVGAGLDQALLLKIFEEFQREPLGNQRPLVEISDITATQRFLAEALYSEILQVCASQGNANLLPVMMAEISRSNPPRR